jgi:hypothetical protein
MNVFREKDCKQASLVPALIFCLGIFIPSSLLEAQSNKTLTSGPAKRAIVDSSVDPLQQISKSMQALETGEPRRGADF